MYSSIIFLVLYKEYTAFVNSLSRWNIMLVVKTTLKTCEPGAGG
jgi:hypothetical protein